VLCPEAEHWGFDPFVDAIEQGRPQVQFMDPAWSLEMIIGRLAEFGPDELGPF
jgi:hypothetical protein